MVDFIVKVQEALLSDEEVGLLRPDYDLAA